MKRLQKEKSETNNNKKDKYAQMKRVHYDCQLQVYIYAFMYVNTEKMAEKNCFTGTKRFFERYKKMSTPGPVPNIGLDLVAYF